MKPIVSYWFIGLLCLCVLPSSSVRADAAAVSALTARLAQMHSYQARFEQLSMDPRGNILASTEGSFAVKRPGLLHWQSEPPMEQWIISDGKELWLYDPDLEQVTVQAVSEDISQTPALLLSGEIDKLAQAYEVAQSTLDDGWVRFDLIPKAPDSLFEQLSLTFNKDTLVQMHLHDALGQRSSFEFSETEINPELDDSLFQFSAPAGVDVIRQ